MPNGMKCYIHNSLPIGTKFQDKGGRSLQAIACYIHMKPIKHEHRN